MKVALLIDPAEIREKRCYLPLQFIETSPTVLGSLPKHIDVVELPED